MNKTLLVALAIVAAIIGIVVIVAGGGDPVEGTGDRASDVSTIEGENPPDDPTLADIAEASVVRSSSDVVFEVTMTRPIPVGGSNDALSFRWDLSANGESTWLVTAETRSGPVAAVRSLVSAFGASTIDDTLPGRISVDGDTLTVTVEGAEIDGFPTAFEWRLTATLDADPADPASGVVTDSAPDNGPGEVE